VSEFKLTVSLAPDGVYHLFLNEERKEKRRGRSGSGYNHERHIVEEASRAVCSTGLRG